MTERRCVPVAMKTYKYKLYRCRRLKHLDRTIELHCEVYNYCIALHRRYYKMYGKYLSANKLKKHLTKVKKRPSKAAWSALGSQSIQDVAERIDRSYQAFFKAKKTGSSRRISIPHFCKRKNYRSFSLKQAGYKFHDGNHITILGRDYKYVAHREFDGAVKLVTIKRDQVGDYWLCVICQQEDQTVIPRMGKAIGYDFGLKVFLTGSDGSRIISPRFFEQGSQQLRHAQKGLSRKKEGSGNRARAKVDVARVYRNIANRRKDWFFKLAGSLAGQYSDICLEDLNMKSMQALWGRKVSDYAFSEFVGILGYQMSKVGGTVHQVPRFYPSSKTCACCGRVLDKLPLDIREWDCPACGSHHDRDVNAAKNILKMGMMAS